MGLNSMADVQQYRKLVEMRNQDIMDKIEDQVLREWSHVTQGLTTDAARRRLLTATGQPREQLPADATPQDRELHAAIQRTTQRGKRELEVGEAHLRGRPYVPGRRGQRTARQVTGANVQGHRGWGADLGRPFIPQGYRLQRG